MFYDKRNTLNTFVYPQSYIQCIWWVTLNVNIICWPCLSQWDGPSFSELCIWYCFKHNWKNTKLQNSRCASHWWLKRGQNFEKSHFKLSLNAVNSQISQVSQQPNQDFIFMTKIFDFDTLGIPLEKSSLLFGCVVLAHLFLRKISGSPRLCTCSCFVTKHLFTRAGLTRHGGPGAKMRCEPLLSVVVYSGSCPFHLRQVIYNHEKIGDFGAHKQN